MSIDQLVQKGQVGKGKDQSTWIHPTVAIHLGQWLSPDNAADSILYLWEQLSASQLALAATKETAKQLESDRAVLNDWAVVTDENVIKICYLINYRFDEYRDYKRLANQKQMHLMFDLLNSLLTGRSIDVPVVTAKALANKVDYKLFRFCVMPEKTNLYQSTIRADFLQFTNVCQIVFTDCKEAKLELSAYGKKINFLEQLKNLNLDEVANGEKIDHESKWMEFKK